MPIGCMVTLRRERMYEFFQKLVTIVLPRVRDFKGISPSPLMAEETTRSGLREQIIFPEIEYDKVDKVRGMNITITTTAKTDEEAFELLKLMGMPFRSLVEEPWRERDDGKGETDPEIQGESQEQVPDLRETEGLHREVRDVQDLFPEHLP